MEYIVNLTLLFFAYSLLGWCIEITLKYFQYHRFINRGFFTGPILPIYGSGAALITLIVGGLAPIIHFINPLIYRVLGSVPFSAKAAAACALLAVFVADYILTHLVMKLVKLGVERSEADNTEQIRKEIYLLLSDKSVFHKRFADAYPDVIYRTERINARLAEVKAETERLRKEAEQRIAERKEQAADLLEPSTLIKSEIIRRQDALIGMLYDDRSASDEMKALKAEIDKDRQRLDGRPLSRILTGKKSGSFDRR